jgi:Protein of unknown function (DUF4079)
MDLPSFIWLWRIAAWSMGLALTTFSFLAISGGTLFYYRQRAQAIQREPADVDRPNWLRPLHYGLGGILVLLVLLLLGIGVVGTLGEFGKLGHSVHLPVGLSVVALTLGSAWCATQISPERPWARNAHLTLNGILLFAFLAVTATGWSVVQKYL